ncbi:unnamed protein product [Lupinus luteus]|uniref:Uncharacterized protein n=1 Tax=Lupinus luteus TaxID=3873 RepID=A0AAV1X7F9_LUPLU
METGRSIKGIHNFINLVKGICVEPDEILEEVFGEASVFLLVCEGLEKGLNGVEELGACEARDEGDAEGLGEVEILAGGVELEEGEGGGMVGEGLRRVVTYLGVSQSFWWNVWRMVQSSGCGGGDSDGGDENECVSERKIEGQQPPKLVLHIYARLIVR